MKFKMLDGSVYTEENIAWIKAVRVRQAEWRRNKEKIKWEQAFAIVVARHYKEKTVPTKFDVDHPWELNYRTHSELAPKVMYIQLRAILMGMMMHTMGGGKVIATNRDGTVTEYPSGRKYKDVLSVMKKK